MPFKIHRRTAGQGPNRPRKRAPRRRPLVAGKDRGSRTVGLGEGCCCMARVGGNQVSLFDRVAAAELIQPLLQLQSSPRQSAAFCPPLRQRRLSPSRRMSSVLPALLSPSARADTLRFAGRMEPLQQAQPPHPQGNSTCISRGSRIPRARQSNGPTRQARDPRAPKALRQDLEERLLRSHAVWEPPRVRLKRRAHEPSRGVTPPSR